MGDTTAIQWTDHTWNPWHGCTTRTCRRTGNAATRTCGSASASKQTIDRVDTLTRIPAHIRFLSCEPLIGPLDFDSVGGLRGIDWVIVGGESGARGKARPCDLSWVRAVAVDCASEGVPCFVKQLGSAAGLRDGHGGNPEEWPQDIRVREFPVNA